MGRKRDVSLGEKQRFGHVAALKQQWQKPISLAFSELPKRVISLSLLAPRDKSYYRYYKYLKYLDIMSNNVWNQTPQRNRLQITLEVVVWEIRAFQRNHRFPKFKRMQ